MKQRLLYIDVLRGIAILTVVYSHILLFCVGYSETSSMTDLLRKYFLNAFFFLSGFMVYKVPVQDQTPILHELWKKVKLLLIPTLISGGLCCVYVHGNLLSYLADDAKGGYWFTIVLFIMMVIYAIEKSCLQWIKNEYAQSIVLLLVAVGAYCCKNMMSAIAWTNYLCLYSVSYYFLMFTIGVLCKKHVDLFHNFLDISWVKTCIFLTAMVGSLVGYVPLLVTCMAVVLLVYFLVKDICTSGFDSNLKAIDASYSYKQWIYRSLQVIGQNTIEIYFLHYFLLFKMPPGVVNFTHSMYKVGTVANSSIVEIAIYGTISVCIALVCIAIRKILAYVPYVSTIMFGK